MKLVPSDMCPIRAKFATARRELAAALIERDDEIDTVLTALVAREHVLLVGQPGSAKSLLLDALLAWTGGRKFSILLTKFSVPEEVFGPVSIIGLKEDRYVRITTGKLPGADFAYIDEIFKSSSAILNTLLKVLNERVFDGGDGVARPVPLKLCVAASNEWPDPERGKELAALFDRLTFRKSVRPILSTAGRKRLLWTRDHTPRLSTTISPAEIDQAHRDALALPWSEDGKEALEAVLRKLTKEGIQPGDRRQFKAVAAAQAGQTNVSPPPRTRMGRTNSWLPFHVRRPAVGSARRTPAGASTGTASVTALAASSRATCPGVSDHPTAPRLSRSCRSSRAPIMTVETVGRRKQPVEGDLRHGLAGLGGDGVEGLHHPVHVLVGHRRALVVGSTASSAGSSPGAAGRGAFSRSAGPTPAGSTPRHPTPWSSPSGINSHS